ncbi:MAG TPA: transcriptional repressor LexA [Sphingobacteriaceae bacterium]|nr:transcriptional repressor LexA [Sphingobacteriaceae bacterium]
MATGNEVSYVYEDLTKRQREIMDFITEETERRGYPPSVREIGKAVGLRSSSTVHGHLTRLEEKGYLRRDPARPRAIEVLKPRPVRRRSHAPVPSRGTVEVPIVGQVTAGQPILAVENIEDTFPLPYDLVREDNVFMLRVRGDSMIGAGIHDGDMVVVRKQDHAQNGDIVVVLLEDEATVKRFYHENTHIRLQPEHPNLEPIITRDAKVLGKVIGLFRRIR